MTAAIPLLASQRRLWATAQIRPGDPVYNVPVAIDLAGPLDTAALQRSLDALVRRHPALRMRMAWVDGQLAQVEVPDLAADLAVTDLTGVAEASRAAVADELAHAFAQRPFDLERGPLFRSLLLRTGPARHRLLWCVHHVVFDGWSLDVFVSELAALYDAAGRGAAPALPEPPVGYAEMVAAQHALAEREQAGSVRYWTERLAGAAPLMELPTRGVRPASPHHRGAYRTRMLPAAHVAALGRVARQGRATTFMGLKALCDLLLRQHGVGDVLLGVALSGRDSAESAGLIGYFARPVVLRSDTSDDPAFTELIARVRDDVLDAHAHPDLPFEAVMDALRMPRDASLQPLYQVVFSHEAQPPPLEAAGVRFAVSYLRLDTTKSDLDITLTDTPDGLRAQMHYRTELFDDTTVDQVLARLATLLERAGQAPQRRLSELAAPSAAERRRFAGGSRRAPAGPDRCVHALVEDQVDRTPEAVAVEADGRRWTYRELDAAANRVAARLRRLGVGPQDAVGVCMQRSPELLAVVLGVLKVGGPYVALDPAALPYELHGLALEAGVGHIVAADRFATLFDAARLEVVGVAEGDGLAALGDEPDRRLARPSSPGDAAAVVYSSGASGEVRGVVVEHRNIAALLGWARRALPAPALSVVPWLSPPSSDAALLEMFAALACGGTVVVADEASDLGAAAGGAGVTVVSATPSTLSRLLAAGRLPATARTVVASGAALPRALVPRLYGCPGVRSVFHGYAAAATAGVSVCGRVPPAEETVALGRPVDGAVAYVLDEHAEPVPPGVIGWLHVGGSSVTRGYAGQPRATAAEYVPDPFSAAPGQRLYATGDLVRQGPDGRLYFLAPGGGRGHRNGCRIDLAEVESAVLAHPQVGEAWAVVRREGGVESLAVVAVAAGPAPAGAEVRAFVERRLPGYLVPDRVAFVPALPLRWNGKPDRGAVLERLAQREVADAGPQASDAERVVALAWAKVLGREVGADEHFFEAGGNSVLLTRLREELRQVTGAEIRMTDLFRHPTVRAMARFCAGGGQEAPAVAADDRAAARQQARRDLAQRHRRLEGGRAR